MSETFNQPVLRQEVATMLAPLISNISSKFRGGGLTENVIKKTLKDILNDTANQAIFKEIKSHYSNNIQLAYEFILHNIKVTDDARKVITSTFKKPDSPIALAFGKEYIPKKAVEKQTKNPLEQGYRSVLQEPINPQLAKRFVPNYWKGMYEDAAGFNNSVFQTAKTSVQLAINTYKTSRAIGEGARTIASKISGVNNGGSTTP